MKSPRELVNAKRSACGVAVVVEALRHYVALAGHATDIVEQFTIRGPEWRVVDAAWR